MLKKLSSLLKRKTILTYLVSIKYRQNINRYVDYKNSGLGHLTVLYPYSYKDEKIGYKTNPYVLAVHCSNCDEVKLLSTSKIYTQKSCGCIPKGRKWA